MRMGYNTMNVMCLGINPLAPARIQGLRYASPPACGLPPLTGLNGWAFFIRLYAGFHRPFTGVPLRSTACLWSVAPDGAKWMNKHQSSYFISFKALTSGFFLSLHHQNNKIDFPSKI